MADAALALIVLFFLALAVLLPIWVYVDASQNSSNSAFLWALVTFLAPLLGVLLYALLGRDGGEDRADRRVDRDDLPSQYR